MNDKIVERVREAKTTLLDKDGKEITQKPKKNKTQKTGPDKEAKESIKDASEKPDKTI